LTPLKELSFPEALKLLLETDNQLSDKAELSKNFENKNIDQ
jgi:hypothetical protein